MSVRESDNSYSEVSLGWEMFVAIDLCEMVVVCRAVEDGNVVVSVDCSNCN